MLIDVSGKLIELEKFKKNNLIDREKKKLVIKLIENFNDKKKEIKEILNKFFINDKDSYNFFEIILEENYDKLIKLELTEKILIKFREKVLIKNLLK